MQNNNWIEEFDKNFSYEYNSDCGFYLLKDNNDYGNAVSDIQIKDLISNLLTKKDQEHKAELERIRGDIEKITIEFSEHESDDYTVGKANGFNQALEDALSIIDSHINKLSTE